MPPSAHRIVLVNDPRAAAPTGGVRRYSLARLRLAERQRSPAPKLAHLTRVRD